MKNERYELNKNLAQMLKGGVIMDVTTPEQAKIAEAAGACAVMALERIPADIRAAGGVSRMSDPKMIKGIQEAVSIPVMAKCRIGHFAEAQILQAIEIDYIDESEVLSPADDKYHIDKTAFDVPFVCGAKDLGEALRRINEGASMIRTKGEPGTGDVVQAVRHMRMMQSEIRRLVSMSADELFDAAKELRVPYDLVLYVHENGKLPVVNFAAGGVATPADASLMLPLVFKMALPAIAAQFVNLLYNLVDRIYIGHIPDIGTDALAGIGVTSAVIILISAFSSIVGAGGAPLAAIALGQGDRERAGKILGNGFILLIIFTLITSSIAYIFMEPILLFTGASGRTIGYATDYLSVYLLGTLFVELSVGLNTFINIQGRPAIAMYSVLIGAILNIALDPLFIFTFDMGVKGAAFATILSQACSAAWTLSFLTSGKASLRLERQYMKLHKSILFPVLALGISPFIMASTESLVSFVLNGMLERFGDIYVSALAIMQSAMMIVSVPLTGFAQGFVPIVSYNYGHHDFNRVKSCFKIALISMFSFNFVLIVFMILFPSVIAGAFTTDQKLITVVCQMMPIFLAGMTIFGLQRTCQNMFVALGQAKVSIFIALLRKVFLLVPLAFVLPHIMGVHGVFAAEGISDATAAICCTLIFAFRFPKILR